MATFKIALTNLGKYNEGELVYTWLELPATDDGIRSAFESIGVKAGTEYEEHFISDYDAPFRIGEYESIEKLNEVAEALESVGIPTPDEFGWWDVEEVLAVASRAESEGYIRDKYEYVGDIISDERLNDMLRNMAVSGDDWSRVKIFLSGIELLTDEWFVLNGYGNAETLTNGHLDTVMSDIIDELRRKLM